MFQNLFKPKLISIHTPGPGQIIPLEQLPDKAFAGRMIGDGAAVDLSDTIIRSPVDGEIVMTFPSNHAIGLKTEKGLEILIHIGIDTVKLNGQGFKRLCKVNSPVKIGDPLVEVDWDVLRNHGLPTPTVVLITNMDRVQSITPASGTCQTGGLLFQVKPKT